MRRRSAPCVAAASIVLLIAACGSDSPAATGTKTVEITITPEGCNPADVTVASGPTVFHVKNNGAESISEFEVLDGSKIIGEKESLTPGLEASVTIDLKPGTYAVVCPGGTTHPTGTLTVTGGGAAPSSASDHSGASAAAACVPSGSATAQATHLKATLSDFTIELDRSTIPAGAVSIDGANKGTHPHEVVVVKGMTAAALPTTADGSVDEDKLPADALVGELQRFTPGNSCSAGLDLTSGSYTLFCNVVGTEGAHLKLGMVTSLTVT